MTPTARTGTAERKFRVPPPPPPIEPEAVSIAAVARNALSEADGDLDKAHAIMLAQVHKDKLLRDALLEPLIEYACRDAITKQVRVDRARLWLPPPSALQMKHLPEAERVRILAASNMRMLMDFPLPGGGKLGSATRDEVMAASRYYEESAQEMEKGARDMAHKGRWLRLVAQALPAKKRVENVFD